MTIFWVDDSGKVDRATDDSQDLSPLHAITVAPESGRQIWDFDTEKWGHVPPRPATMMDVLDALIETLQPADRTKVKAVRAKMR